MKEKLRQLETIAAMLSGSFAQPVRDQLTTVEVCRDLFLEIYGSTLDEHEQQVLDSLDAARAALSKRINQGE